MVNLEARRVLFNTESKNVKLTEKGVVYLKIKEVTVNKIKQTCIDISLAFTLGVITHLPNTEILFDKFHIAKEINKTMNTLKKQERIRN